MAPGQVFAQQRQIIILEYDAVGVVGCVKKTNPFIVS
jgi:hypothetical protein